MFRGALRRVRNQASSSSGDGPLWRARRLQHSWGLVSSNNWTTRVPRSFRQDYRARVAAGEAFDMASALGARTSSAAHRRGTAPTSSSRSRSAQSSNCLDRSARSSDGGRHRRCAGATISTSVRVAQGARPVPLASSARDESLRPRDHLLAVGAHRNPDPTGWIPGTLSAAASARSPSKFT